MFQSANEGFKDTIFWDIFIEPWQEKDYGIGIITAILGLIVAFGIYIIGLFVYINIEHDINGLDKGVVVSKVSFKPAHTDLMPMTVYNGNKTTTIIVPIDVPDTTGNFIIDLKN